MIDLDNKELEFLEDLVFDNLLRCMTSGAYVFDRPLAQLNYNLYTKLYNAQGRVDKSSPEATKYIRNLFFPDEKGE